MVRLRGIWRPDEAGLELLEGRSGPFSTPRFRKAVTATLRGWNDVSFGGRAADGALAAVPLMQLAGRAESVPPSGYGAVEASRPLSATEVGALLSTARSVAHADTLVLRTLDWPNPVAGGRVFATASVVPVGGVGAPTERYARLAKRSLRKARAAGALVAVAGSADAFWRLYVQASEDWNSRYPEQLIRYLVDTGIARIHEVSVDGRVVAALLTLVEGSHWMCWLAAQNAEGRIIAASYLAYDAVLAEASLSGVHMVNLGASAGGGSEFKHHLGAIPMEMRMWNETSPAATAITVARSVRRRVASVVRRPTGGHA